MIVKQVVIFDPRLEGPLWELLLGHRVCKLHIKLTFLLDKTRRPYITVVESYSSRVRLVLDKGKNVGAGGHQSKAI